MISLDILFFLKLTLERGPYLKGPLRVFAIAFEGEKAMAQKRGPLTGWSSKFGKEVLCNILKLFRTYVTQLIVTYYNLS